MRRLTDFACNHLRCAAADPPSLRGGVLCAVPGAVAGLPCVPRAGPGARGGSGMGHRTVRGHRGRGRDGRALAVDTGTGRATCLPLRRVGAADGARRRGHRSAGAGLLRGLFQLGGVRARAVRGGADGVRRGDAGAGAGRRPDRAVRHVGVDDGLLLPPHRPCARAPPQPARRPPGADRDDDGRAGHARRLPDAGSGSRYVQHLRHPRPAAARRRHRHGGADADSRGGAVEVGGVALQSLAAGCDGGTDARLRVSARRRDGQSRRLSGRAADPRVRRRAALACDRAGAGLTHDAARRLARAARDGPQATAGLRHRQPTRLPHRPVRHGHLRRRARRGGDAHRARAVQGPALPRRRHHRPRHGDAAPGPALRAGPFDACGVRRRRPGRGVDGHAAAADRLRRQGGRADLAAAGRKHLRMDAGGRRRRFGADERVHPSLPVGGLRGEARSRTRRRGGGDGGVQAELSHRHTTARPQRRAPARTGGGVLSRRTRPGPRRVRARSAAGPVRRQRSRRATRSGWSCGTASGPRCCCPRCPGSWAVCSSSRHVPSSASGNGSRSWKALRSSPARCGRWNGPRSKSPAPCSAARCPSTSARLWPS